MAPRETTFECGLRGLALNLIEKILNFALSDVSTILCMSIVEVKVRAMCHKNTRTGLETRLAA